ncbi:MAG: OmpA family protein [Brevundimonas sp.]|uniref:OmpA family protein n=1 Tax=Brevundimonas sp. TaxID=1871086 RepID=UPI00262302EA|nr:OmpA family protein [Brevundimonas sp.]MDI6623453.1 OmpA family protein [Brevundimonas sp.]MDQ7811732.1 OmpA family protein [Brevundimonas sp.]
MTTGAATAGNEASVAGAFDLSTVPVSAAPLGAFPYFSLPDGYVSTGEVTHDFFSFPFWVKGAFRAVEGKVYMSMIEPEDDQQFSRLELQRNIEAVINRAGGIKISQAPVTTEAINALGDQTISDTTAGTGDIYNNEVATYVIRRADKTIWVHFDAGNSSAGLTVAETAPLVVTAGLLPADQLRRELEADGRVAIQVNFAVDKADILPESRGQIDAVLALLRDQENLRLGVEGHTDNTGSAAHNRALSEARARSVVAALTGAGIAVNRLEPRGFGPDRPVADNDAEAGRAKNRRVELVKL